MYDFAAILKANPNGVMATVDGEKVATRVFQYLFTDGKKFYFGTESEKPVYAQMKAHPYVSFCTYAEGFNPVISLNGKAVFVEDAKLKAQALDENPNIKELFKTPNNPVFKLFYIDTEEVVTFSFTEGSKTHKL